MKDVSITTATRGVVVGRFIAPDEFDSDADRYGFQIETAPHKMDIVFLDEIVDVSIQHNEIK